MGVGGDHAKLNGENLFSCLLSFYESQTDVLPGKKAKLNNFRLKIFGVEDFF